MLKIIRNSTNKMSRYFANKRAYMEKGLVDYVAGRCAAAEGEIVNTPLGARSFGSLKRSHVSGTRMSDLITKSALPSRERSLALIKLEEAVMWANEAIKRKPL